MNYRCITMISITVVVVIGMMTYVHANSHNRKCCKIGWVIPIVIRRNIGDVSRGIDILYNGRRFDHHNGSFCRSTNNDSVCAFVPWIGSNCRGGRLF